MSVVTIVRHRVADFDTWLDGYHGARAVQAAGGVRSAQVLRDPADPNSVTVLHSFDSAAAAQAFLGQDALKQAMVAAGVDPSSLEIQVLDDVESSVLA